MKRNFNGHKETSLHTCLKLHTGRKWNLLAPCFFLIIVVAVLLSLYDRKIIYAGFMALNEILQVCGTDVAAQPCSTPQQHIFQLPSQLSLMNEHKYTAKSIVVITVMATVMVTTIGIFICIWKSADTVNN